MEEFRVLGERLRNWGRWGDDDERGTVNFITPECIVAAASLVRKGVIFDLGLPLDEHGPQTGALGRINPVRLMAKTGRDGESALRPGGGVAADDFVFMPLQAATHWDALAHYYYDDQLYNGYPSSTVTAAGALRNSIDKQRKGIAGRGVLVDIAALHGVDSLAVGYAITPDDLDAALARQQVEVRSGDILLVRTGFIRQFFEHGRDAYTGPQEPGLGMACCQWLADREVAAVCADNHGVEVIPSENPDEFIPLHGVLIRDMGMSLGESWDLEELGADCAEDGVYECFVCAPVLKFSRACGTPLNPLAFK